MNCILIYLYFLLLQEMNIVFIYTSLIHILYFHVFMLYVYEDYQQSMYFIFHVLCLCIDFFLFWL